MSSAARAFPRVDERPAAPGASPTDVVIVAYLVVTGALIAVFHRNLPSWPVHLALRVVLLAAVGALVLMPKRGAGGFRRFVHEWYALPFFLLVYREVGTLVHLVRPDYIDPQLIALEARLFGGVQPSVWLAANGPQWVGEVMLFVYASYWWYGPLVGAYVYRRSRDAFREFVFVVTVTMLTHYVLFILLPAAGPRFALADQGATMLTGSPFAHTVNAIVRTEGLRGGAFPSSHVAVMFAVTWCAWFHARPFRWLGTVLSLLLLVAVVWGRFHYALDAAAGAVLGVLLSSVAQAIFHRYGYRLGQRLDHRVAR